MKITTGGESHGKMLLAILEGLPAGLKLDLAAVNAALKRRQSGYGRGARQQIESDSAEFVSGVRGGVTVGSPVSVLIRNRDYANWEAVMSPEHIEAGREVTKVRPGHADLPGMLKYGFTDARNVLERASARETAVRVAAGEVCRQLLSALGIEVSGYVVSVGDVQDTGTYRFGEIQAKRGAMLGMMNEAAEREAMQKIDISAAAGDTLGGVIEVRARGVKSGFGSYVSANEKLNARLAGALMSIQAAKGVEIGMGFGAAAKRGSEVHDEIFYTPSRGFYRETNRAGGIEGGMSNGEEIVLRLAMKPIPTLMRGLSTVDVSTKAAARAASERSDVCAILAFETVAESVLCAELCAVILERLGGDTLTEVQKRYGELQ